MKCFSKFDSSKLEQQIENHLKENKYWIKFDIFNKICNQHWSHYLL